MALIQLPPIKIQERFTMYQKPRPWKTYLFSLFKDKHKTDKYCQRCIDLSIHVLENGEIPSSRELLPNLSVASLAADCALCAQLRQVFEFMYGSSILPKKWEYSSLVSLCDLQLEGRTHMFLKFQSSRTHPYVIYLFPTQSTKLAHSPIIRQIVCSEKPDYRLIRTQLDICKKSHGQKCASGVVRNLALRVINCKSRQVVTAKLNEPYVCLSYVWGTSAANEAQSFKKKLPTKMPKTIEDAMAVAVALEVPFLWVDRYCINQKNLQERHDTIQNMNRIYEGAEITIIAACGDDPHHGLPGIRGTPRKPPLSLTLADTTFAKIESTAAAINTTKWAKRGWTYQEMLLSRRRLVFTDTQMYFQCRTTYCMESLHPNLTAADFDIYPRLPHLQFRAFPSNGIGHSAYDLQQRLMEYYKRQLTFDTDIINAFEGILSAFDQSESCPFRVTHFYGVPLMYKHDDKNLAQNGFISSLSWTAGKKRKTQDGFCFEKLRTSLFPSWSWASTKVKSLKGCFDGLSPGYPLRLDQNIQVRFTHQEDGDMDLYAFIEHRDSYEKFLPLIKLTTWVISCSLYCVDDNVLFLLGTELDTEFLPEASCNAIYLAHLGRENTLDNQMIALVLEELEPGVFRRIGLWDRKFTSIVSDLEFTYMATKDMQSINRKPVFPYSWERRTVTIV